MEVVKRNRVVVDKDDDKNKKERGGRTQVFVTGDELLAVLVNVWSELNKRGREDIARDVKSLLKNTTVRR